MRTRAMMSGQQRIRGQAKEPLALCIEACFACAQDCIACAEACLSEETATNLERCIRLNLDCADACAAAGPVMLRRTAANETLIRRMVETCAELCHACAKECDRHAQEHEHCRLCAEACRDCERACRAVMASMGSIGS